jgi:hypothetical protein
MSLVSDVEAAFTTAQSTWSTNRSHAIAHILLGFIIFFVYGATYPDISPPQIDPNYIMESDWYKLAKDTGAIYLAFIIPIICIAAYISLFNYASNFIGLTLSSFSTYYVSYMRTKDYSALLTIASSMKNDKFDASDLQAQIWRLYDKYSRSKDFSPYLLTYPSQYDSRIYFGDFTLFVIVWVILFTYMRDYDWVSSNENIFLPVLLTLIVLVFLSWLRLSTLIGNANRQSLYFVVRGIQGDPEMSFISEMGEDKEMAISKRLISIVKTYEEYDNRKTPSLTRFIVCSLFSKDTLEGIRELANDMYSPYKNSYGMGRKFSSDADMNTKYDDNWLIWYVSYIHYRIHVWLATSARNLFNFIWQLITGAPP